MSISIEKAALRKHLLEKRDATSAELRGISSGTTPRLSLNVDHSNDNGSYVSTTASGIVLNTSYYYQNEAGYNYIYYAHA